MFRRCCVMCRNTWHFSFISVRSLNVSDVPRSAPPRPLTGGDVNDGEGVDRDIDVAAAAVTTARAGPTQRTHLQHDARDAAVLSGILNFPLRCTRCCTLSREERDRVTR